jgi:hypothetical protein
VTLQTRNTATRRFQPLIRFGGVANDEQRVSEGRLHAVESTVLYNWRSQSLDMRHILQLNGLNVSSELGVTLFVMDCHEHVIEVKG